MRTQVQMCLFNCPCPFGQIIRQQRRQLSKIYWHQIPETNSCNIPIPFLQNRRKTWKQKERGQAISVRKRETWLHAVLPFSISFAQPVMALMAAVSSLAVKPCQLRLWPGLHGSGEIRS